MNIPKASVRTILSCDGGRDLVGELFSGTLSEQSENLLVMSGESVCQGAKEFLLETGGGISGNIVTVRKLAERLYDMLGLPLPVIGLTGREYLVGEIMEEEDLPSLKTGRKPSSRMVVYISREIGDLIKGQVDPGILAGGRKGDLSSIYKRYLEYLQEHELTDPEQIPIMVKDSLSAGRVEWKRMALYLIGDQLPSYRDMILALSEVLDDVIIVEHGSRGNGISSFSIPPRGERGRFVLRYGGKVPFIEEATPFEEVEAIARFVKASILSGKVDPWDVTVVFPGRRRYDPLVELLFERYGIPLEMGKDLRLGSVGTVSLIKDLLGSIREMYPRETILRVLSSGIVDVEELDWKDLERITRDIRLLSGSSGEWIDRLLEYSTDGTRDDRYRSEAGKWSEWLTGKLTLLDSIGKGKRSVRERCAEIITLIDELGISDMLSRREEDDMERKGLERFLLCLRNVRRRGSLLDMKGMNLDDLLSLVTLEVDKEKLSTKPPGRGVRVMGLEGAVGEEIKLLVAGGLDASSIPSGIGGFRILTERDRIDLGLDEVLQRRKQLEELSIVLSSAQDVVLAYHTEEEGKPVPISPFITELEREDLERPEGLLSTVDITRRIGELSDPSFDLYDRRGDGLDDIMYDRESLIGMLEPDLGEMVRSGLKGKLHRCSGTRNPYKGSITEESDVEMLRSRFGPDHIWSPSRLETYRECPYRFFSRYVIGLMEREDLEPGVPPERKGLIFHSIAERFYKDWKSGGRKRVTYTNLPLAREVMNKVCLEVLDEYSYSGPYWDALKDLLLGNDGEKGLLEEFLTVEASYQGLFDVDGTEVKFGPLGGNSAVNISLPGQEEGPDSFKLQGSIDRVDRLKDERGDLFFIWDYKTGRNDIPEESLQVPLYLAALRKIRKEALPGGGGYYYIRRKGSIRRDPVLGGSVWELQVQDGKEESKNLDMLSERITSDITTSLEIIDSIRCGDFSPDPACRSRTCPYIDFCRRREFQ